MFRKDTAFLALMLCVCLLSGCTTASSSEAKIYTGEATAPVSSTATAKATVSDLEHSFTASAQIVFLSTKEVYLEADSATFVESKVTIGQKVQKGDVLAVFSGSGTNVRRTEIELSVKQIQTELSDTLAAYDKSIAELQEQLDELLAEEFQYNRTVINETILQMKIDKLLLQKEQAAFRADKQMRDLKSELEDIEEAEEELIVVSPKDGVISSVDYISPGTLCYRGQHIVSLYDPTQVLLYAVDTFSGTLRYGQTLTGTFSYGPQKAEVSGVVVSCDALLPDKYDFGGALIAPLDTQNIAMLQGITESVRGKSIPMTATDISVPDVLSIPKEALAYRNNVSYVYVMQNGVPHFTYVQTGLSNGKNVMILSGLSDGDTVTLN